MTLDVVCLAASLPLCLSCSLSLLLPRRRLLSHHKYQHCPSPTVYLRGLIPFLFTNRPRRAIHRLGAAFHSHISSAL